MAATVIATALGAVAPSCAQEQTAHHAIAKDWITHHVVFSNPGTREQAIQNGTYDRWLRIVTDPRYIMQQEERSLMASAPSGTASAGDAEDDASDDSQPPAAPYNGPLPHGLSRAAIAPSPDAVPAKKLPTHHRLKKDWSEGLTNTGGTAGAPGATTGLGEFPATYTVGTSPSCSNDFAVFNTGQAGSSSEASIIAYNNMYGNLNGNTCTANPTVYWAYNTGGTIVNSVAFYAQTNHTNQTGTQLYFVQTNGSGVAQLVLLSWQASTGTLTSPASPTSVAASAYLGCTTPCMTALTLTGSPSDTYSAPFYDPASDTIYVGDDGGKLHKFTTVFTGTPTESGSPWPVSVNTNASLGSPVFYNNLPTSSAVFVGDYPYNYASACQPNVTNGNTPCGFLYSVNSSGTVVKTVQLDYNNGIIDSPILDATAGEVYVFVGQDSSTSCALPPLSTGAPCAAVYQFPVSFGAAATGTEAQVGAGSQFMMSGAFDNAYYTSANPASPTGHLYVVGGTGAVDNTLYQVSINSNVMSPSATAGPKVATNYDNGYYAAGLQVTEYLNGSADYVFLSVLAFGSATGCTSPSLFNGCAMGFNVTSGTITTSQAVTGALPEEGGTSGIVVDYAAGTAGNIYFSTLLNTSCTAPAVTAGCAIQTQQQVP